MRLLALHPPVDAGPDVVPDRYRLARQFPEHTWDEVVVRKEDAVATVRRLAIAGGFDAAVNFCDGGWDEPYAGVEVAVTLERFGIAYTGAGPAFHDPPRPLMKLAAQQCGVAVPPHAVVGPRTPLDPLVALGFPLIVKPPQGYGSTGLDRDARVADAAALAHRVGAMCAIQGEALVERFVEGREITVLVVEGEDGPIVYPPIEFRFPAGESFKHEALKWDDHSSMAVVPVADPGLRTELERIGREVFVALAGDGYARLDLRVDDRGQPWFLEINPNCAVFFPPEEYGSADHCLALVPDGHRAFLAQILAAGRRRWDRSRPRWALVHRDGRFVMVAARAIEAGAVIDDGASPGALRLDRALPPSAWRPLAAGPGANVEVRGGRLIARRPLRVGEVLTVSPGRGVGVPGPGLIV